MPSLPPRVLACAAYFCLVLASYYVLKPVRDALFMDQAGAENLPWAHLLVVGAVFVAVELYEVLARRAGQRRLMLVANGLFLASILGFWLFLGPLGGLADHADRLAWVFYAWVSVYSVFGVSLFWSFTHTLFDPAEGRRYYGYIGSGGTIGAMLGGWLAKRYAQQVGTVDLLLVSAALFVPCLAIGGMLGYRVAGPSGKPIPPGPDRPVARRGAFEILAVSPYLRGIAWIVLVAVALGGLDDYRYKKVIELQVHELDARTAFMGGIYFATNVAGLVIGLVLTPWLQTRWGPRPGLLSYPFFVAAGGVALMYGVGIDLVFWLMVFQQSSAYSIFQTSRELLFTPRSAEEKFVVKGFVGTFVFRLGTGLASVFLLYSLPPDPVVTLSYLTVPLAGVLAWIGWRLADGFEKLQAGSVTEP